HTRFSRDWSSDVCSSDLDEGDEAPHGLLLFVGAPEAARLEGLGREQLNHFGRFLVARHELLDSPGAGGLLEDAFDARSPERPDRTSHQLSAFDDDCFHFAVFERSEERRVGKECRCPWLVYRKKTEEISTV